MLLSKIIQHHFETTGSFKMISKEVFYNDVVNSARDSSMSVEDYLYSCLGYKHTPEISSSKRYSIRCAYVRGELDGLKRLFRCRSVEQLLIRLDGDDCLGENCYKKQVIQEDIVAFVRVIASHLRNNKELYFATESKPVTSSDYIKAFRLEKSKTALLKKLKSEEFSKLVLYTIPNFEKKDGVVPIITGCKFFVPYIPSKELTQTILNLAVLHACTNYLDMPMEMYYSVMNFGFSYYRLCEEDNKKYLMLIDYANSLKITVKMLLNMCNINHINILDQYKEYKCLVFPTLYSENLNIYTESSKDIKSGISIDHKTFEALYSRDLLRTLYIEDGVPYVHFNRKMQLKDFLRDVD